MYDSFILRLDRGGLTKLSFPTEMHNSTPFLIPFALVPLALAVQSACAAESDDGYTLLDTSVVSATGYEQDTREAPASVSVTTARELQTKPYNDIGSAIGDVPGVDIGFTKMGNTSVSIRGFDSAYTLILVDGKRQNVSTAMMDNGFDPTSAFMPPVGMIERIEVLRGPASVAWGTDAVGGVVNIITKRHPKEFTGSFTVEGTLQQHDEYGNKGGTSFYLGVPIKEDVLSLTLRGRYAGTGKSTIKTPQGRYATHTSTETYNANLGARLDMTVNPQNHFYVDGDFTRFKGGSMQTSSRSIQSRRWYHKYSAIAGHHGTYDFGETESYLQFNALDMLKTETDLNPWSRGEGSSTHGSIGSPLKSTCTYTAATKLTAPLDFQEWGSMKLTAGGDVNYETFVDDSTSGPLLHQELDQTVASGFLEGEYFISEEWIATLGGRLSWSDIFGAHIAPRAYLVYRPHPLWSIKGGIAAGYKTPNVKQLFNGAVEGSEVGDRTYGNPDLEPEESWSYELSTTVDFGPYAQLTVGGFYTDFKNMIASEDMDGADHSDGSGGYDQRYINYGKVRTQGVEVLFKTAPFHGFRFTGGYTFTDAEITSGEDKGERPNELPRHALTARVDYDLGDLNVYVKSLSKFDMAVDPSTKNAPQRKKYRDYTIVDLGANYRYDKNHLFAVAVNNIFDQSTNDWVMGSSGSWANAYSHYVDGRNLWLSYTYSF